MKNITFSADENLIEAARRQADFFTDADLFVYIFEDQMITGARARRTHSRTE